MKIAFQEENLKDRTRCLFFFATLEKHAKVSFKKGRILQEYFVLKRYWLRVLIRGWRASVRFLELPCSRSLPL